jgi:chloramphenicol 3-O-phosphotransferase
MATYLPEQWSARATITYRSNTVLIPLLDHTWEPEIGVGRGDTVNIPSFTQNSAATKRGTFGIGATITWDSVQESQVQLVVNQFAYKAFRMPAEMSLQAAPAYVGLLLDGIGSAIALQADSEISSDDSNGLDALTAIGVDGADVTDDTVLAGEEVLNDSNAPLDGRFFVVSPGTRSSLLKIEAYRNSQYDRAVGNIDGAKGAGFINPLYSLQVVMSNNLEAGTSGKKNAMFQRECIAFAGQGGVNMGQGFNATDGFFAEYWGYMVYGFKLVKSTFGREVDGK